LFRFPIISSVRCGIRALEQEYEGSESREELFYSLTELGHVLGFSVKWEGRGYLVDCDVFRVLCGFACEISLSKDDGFTISTHSDVDADF
jgi:hypothetical protein